MSWIVVHMDRVLIVCGTLTATMLFPMIAPRIAFKTMFGEAAQGPLGELLTRNWGEDWKKVPGLFLRPMIAVMVVSEGATGTHYYQTDSCEHRKINPLPFRVRRP